MHPRGSVSLPVDRSHVLIVLSFGFGGWNTAQAVHTALLVVPGDVVGGDEFDVGQGAQRAADEAASPPGCTRS